MIHSNDTIKSVSELTFVNDNSDEIISQLLRKLDKGTETVINLRTLLAQKTAELNGLIQQLDLINQVLMDMEYGTGQIESVLKDLRLDKAVYAEATLESAIQSASGLCVENNPKIAWMNKLNTKLKQLGIDPSYYFRTLDDAATLQKATVELEIAKTISLCIKADYKRRNVLLKNKNAQEQTKQLGDKIREELNLWKMYTRDAPFFIQHKPLNDLLEAQDQQLVNMKSNSQVLYTKHTSSSMAKIRPGSVLKLRKLLTLVPF
ncbi:hypothetical protein G6F46_008041 [Rhizopus delemar]|uniref:Uncharacterized protein n=2 Tax=Rhizopus TaxID=4842 RepID=A0A9P7CTK8_9FUNG|nr:hypothetical protein G6F43_005170 [Rhizopus delemar]KAG1543830.1 hypothetical protein G6F51_006435 [Rhizopus arrhizus]KAG1459290.1 hypothetical protein G6F55_004851 [Rhizopus delemar]KAG1494990.1 hypothetical protein G6F54_007489 [Rhizopus delemar]KAG1508979.1 hypothetical protein G6F53_007787 [Rhizopus delemar]